MKINYRKLKTVKFHKRSKKLLLTDKKKYEKEIKKLDKKIEKKVEKLNNKIEKQKEENKVVFNRNAVEQIVDLETQQELLQYKVNSLEEMIDEMEEMENEILDNLL
tara:strand:- start:303 stop:620 length:318 start_codon:yes stop_codon:yes gene_type:complete